MTSGTINLASMICIYGLNAIVDMQMFLSSLGLHCRVGLAQLIYCWHAGRLVKEWGRPVADIKRLLGRCSPLRKLPSHSRGMSLTPVEKTCKNSLLQLFDEKKLCSNLRWQEGMAVVGVTVLFTCVCNDSFSCQSSWP